MRPTHEAVVRNRFCADTVELRLWVQSRRVREAEWEGEACAVCSESADTLLDGLRGCAVEDVDALLKAHETHTGSTLLATPSRVPCAHLPVQAVREALHPSTTPVEERSAAMGHREDAWHAALAFRERGLDVAIATLVEVIGSSPCPLGSHLVVAANGEFWGAVSGGCVESAVVQAGISMLEGDRCPATLDFQIANSQAGEVALPCGGQVRVHIGPAPGTPMLRKYTARGRGLARIVDLKSGAESLESVDQTAAGIEDGRFIQPLVPRPRLVLVGGTRVAQVLATLASTVGFEVIVVEPREGFAGPGRFDVPVQCESTERLRTLIHGDTAVVMLTHDARIDDPGLQIALASTAFYVGALGSRKTQRGRLERLGSVGVPAEQLARLRGPAGLSIGAVGPEEIALSILSEVVATRRRSQPAGVGFVVLAAGTSTRAGPENKLLFPIDGVPMLRRVVETMLEVGGPVIVVLGHEAERVKRVVDDLPVQFVVNADYASGMASSIGAGVEALDAHAVSAAFVVLGDMPFVKPDTMRRMARAHTPATNHLVIVPVAEGAAERRRGNPVLWPRRYFDALRGLSGDTGGRAILARAPGAVLEIDVDDEGALVDVDIPSSGRKS